MYSTVSWEKFYGCVTKWTHIHENQGEKVILLNYNLKIYKTRCDKTNSPALEMPHNLNLMTVIWKINNFLPIWVEILKYKNFSIYFVVSDKSCSAVGKTLWFYQYLLSSGPPYKKNWTLNLNFTYHGERLVWMSDLTEQKFYELFK